MISIKNILITGGAGFIGSNLCDYFIEKNNHITCLDNFATKLPNNSETDTKHHLHSAKNLTFETACTGLPMRARRSASAENRMGLISFVTFLHQGRKVSSKI